MKSLQICALFLSAALPCAAIAGPLPPTRPIADLGKLVASLDGEYLSYSGPYGSRRIINGTSRVDLGKTNVSIGVANGQRKAGDDKFNATRATVAVAHDWTKRISTRTSVSISSDKPVFVNREFLQEVSYKPLPSTVLTLGGKYSRYYGGVDALSWSAGVAQYFGGGSVSYRFSTYDVQHIGRTTGHLVSLKLKDNLGSSQLWLGHGTALHDATWLASPEKGEFSSMELRRIQPIGGGVGLMLGVNRAWYKTDSANFHSTGARLGLVFE